MFSMVAKEREYEQSVCSPHSQLVVLSQDYRPWKLVFSIPRRCERGTHSRACSRGAGMNR